MFVKSLNKIRESEELSALLTFLIWSIFCVLLILLVDKLLPFIFVMMLCFGFVYPAVCLVMFFRLCKRHGVMWYFPAAVTAATAIMYVCWHTFRLIIPNLLVLTLLCLLFGCGLGGCFSDKEAVRAYRENRRLKKLGEDKPYNSIIDEKPVGKDRK